MYNIPIGKGISIFPKTIPKQTVEILKNEMTTVMDGKIIQGEKNINRHGFKTLGHFGPYQRDELPPVLDTLSKDVVQFIKSQKTTIESHINQEIPENWTINQIDVVKIKSTQSYNLTIEEDQEISGPIVTLVVDGTYLPSIVAKNGDPVVVSSTDESIPTNSVQNPTNNYESILMSIPASSMIIFPSDFTQTYNRDISRSLKDNVLLVPRTPSSTLDSSIPTPSFVLDENSDESENVAKTKKIQFSSCGMDNLGIFEPESSYLPRLSTNDLSEPEESKRLLAQLRENGLKTLKKSNVYLLTLRNFVKYTGEEGGEGVSSIVGSKTNTSLTATGKKKKNITVSKGVDLDLEEIDEEKAAAFEKVHVHLVYDAIARHFSGTRYQAWPQVDKFVSNIPSGSLVADVGCGNGKYLGLNPNITTIGCDISVGLTEIAYNKGFNVTLGDSLQVPFKTENFDSAISIAVMHHLSTLKRRQQALAELIRIVKPGGKILVTAWALEQESDSRRVFEKGDVWVPFKTPANVKEQLAEDKVKEQEKLLNKIKQTRLLVNDGKKVQDVLFKKYDTLENVIVEDSNTNVSNTDDKNIQLNLSNTISESILINTENNVEQYPHTETDTIDLPQHSHTNYNEKMVELDPAKEIDTRPPPEDCARFYHVFRKGEFEDLAQSVATNYNLKFEVEEVFYDKGNWCLIVEKK